jgi:hypothetical protein
MSHIENNETHYQELEYDNMYPEVIAHRKFFLKSKHNIDSESEYDCILNYLEENLPNNPSIESYEGLKELRDDMIKRGEMPNKQKELHERKKQYKVHGTPMYVFWGGAECEGKNKWIIYCDDDKVMEDFEDCVGDDGDYFKQIHYSKDDAMKTAKDSWVIIKNQPYNGLKELRKDMIKRGGSSYLGEGVWIMPDGSLETD